MPLQDLYPQANGEYQAHSVQSASGDNSGWLITNNQLWLKDQGAGNSDTLALAARELVWVAAIRQIPGESG
jgi:hypothetical protein